MDHTLNMHFCMPTPMPIHCRWSPEQFYRVVSDVQEYKHFVPWCQQSKVLTLSKDGTHMTAELEVGFQMLKER